MGKNRDKLGIVASVLEAANSGEKKTGIMFRANLSFKLLEKYIAKAESAGLLVLCDGQYVLTDDGKKFLVKYREFAERDYQVQKLNGKLSVERQHLSSLCDRSVSN